MKQFHTLDGGQELLYGIHYAIKACCILKFSMQKIQSILNLALHCVYLYISIVTSIVGGMISKCNFSPQKEKEYE